MKAEDAPPIGTPVKVGINGVLTDAVYDGWSEKYNMPMVLVGGKRLPRAIKQVCTADQTSTATEATSGSAAAPGEKPAKVHVNENVGTFSVLRNGYYHCYVDGVLRSRFKTKD